MSGFDFDAAVQAPFRMQPGLRRLAAGASQLHGITPAHAVFRAKLGVLQQHADQALLCAPGFDALPALQALGVELAACGAHRLHANAYGLLALDLGWQVDWDGRLHASHPQAHEESGHGLQSLRAEQRLAGLLSLALHEDLAILDGQTARLLWLAVCLPSHWVPADKIGRSFAQVHAPVADNATLLAAAAHLSRLVCEPQRWERFVWGITPHAGHDGHPHRVDHPGWPHVDPEAVVAQAHWRTEHQTFIPLPSLGQAVFTIHVEVGPLRDAVRSPQRAAALHAALASMSEAVIDYRGLRGARAPLLAWLAEVASGSGEGLAP